MSKKMLMLTCASMLMLGSHYGFCQEVNEQMPPRPEVAEQVEGHHHMKMHGMHKHNLGEKLGLSDEQRQKAEELRKADFEKMKPLIEEMKELRAKMNAIREENMKSFEEILTPEQKIKFDEIKKERSEKMKEFPHRHHGPRGMKNLPEKGENK